MKHFFAPFCWLAAISLLPSCNKDAIQFSIHTFKVNEQFVDRSGRYAADAVLRFEIKAATDDAANDYFIESFDFTYRVNNSSTYPLQSDRNMRVHSFSVNAIVDLLNLYLPSELEGVLIKGDRILFSLRATDSCGMQLEQVYEVVIE